MKILKTYLVHSQLYLKYLLIVSFILIAFTTLEADQKKTICVNMIVKNESEVIEKCLGSVKPLIDYWVIVDTGSTDGTQEIIKEFMKDIPGELHERPWLNFAHNRNEALQLAKGKADYVLIMDADDYLILSEDFVLPNLTKDSYFFAIQFGGLKYSRKQLIRNELDWKWIGVLHEYLNLSAPHTHDHLANVTYKITTEGARSQDPLKYYKDIEVLETALEKEPYNDRYRFYLAQSYRDVGNHQASVENYKKRVEMGGWDQEVYHSLLQIAILQEKLDMPIDTVVDAYFKAYLYRPSRAEPFYYLATYLRKKGSYYAAFYMANAGLKISQSQDILFVEDWIYKYGMLFEYSISAYWVGEYQKSENACLKLLEYSNLPSNFRDATEKNLVWARSKLLKTQ